MKKLINILLLVIVTFTNSFAQPYGNEWIDHSQLYLKFYVVEDGVYRISYNDLNGVIDPDTIDPNNIQIWGRGEQQYVFIEGESDGSFDINDFIEFYAMGNDGWLDTLLYNSPKSQVNPYHSLYNDTATYYITFNSGGGNRYNDITTGSISTPDPYFWEEVVAYDPQQFWQGEYDNGAGGKQDVYYTKGEGWFYTAFSGAGSRTTTLSTPGAYPLGPDAKAEGKYAGVNDPGGTNDHHVEIFYNSQTVASHSNPFPFFDMFKAEFTIPISQISNTTDLVYRNGSSGNSLSKVGVAYSRLLYPRTYSSVDTSQKMLRIPQNSSSHQISLSSFSNPFNQSFVYDFENNTRTSIGGSSVEFTLPSGNERQVFVFSSESSNFKSPINIQLINTDGFFTDFLATTIDSAFVIVTSEIFANEAGQYANYRSGNAGGNHQTLVAYVEELYDQFGYGIHKHPLSIRFFADYISDNFNTKPKNLFLIGKSINYTTCRESGPEYAQNIVPTIGFPSTDNYFTAGLNGTLYECDIPTGRLAAIEPGDITDYLGKVQELELNQNTPSEIIGDKEWMKHVIHFGGGSGVSQQDQFAGYLESFADKVENTYFGAYVDTFYKNTSQTIQPGTYDLINDWISEGASLITFFGHSSAQGFDVALDDPEAYDNQGKYPIFTAFGCQSGDIHGYIDDPGQGSTASESFILTADHGAIGFLASTHAGIALNMRDYGDFYYENIAYNKYGQSIGEIVKATVQDYQPSTPANSGVDLRKATCLEMSLHGDPSIKINPHPLPDYALEAQNVTFDPEIISTDESTFTMNIEIINLGRAVDDDVTIKIVRKVEGNPVDTITDVIPEINYSYTYSYDFPTDPGVGGGFNQFDIMVDYQNDVQEITDLNNNLLENNAPEIYISSSDLIPVFPYNYAVVENSDVILKASTADVFAPTRTYRIQIDHNDTYDSQTGNQPLDETSITQSGGVVTWQPNLGANVTDSSVFFWRCAPEPIDSSTVWREHSFQYIDGKTGWGQDDFFQFKNNDYWVIDHNRSNEKFEFGPLTRIVSCQTVGGANTIPEYNNTYYTWNGQTIKSGICHGDSAIYIAVFDSLTLQPWEEHYFDALGIERNADHNFGNSYDKNGCFPGQHSPARVFIFPTKSDTSINNMVNMLNSVPSGNYILFYTARSGNFRDTSVWQSSDFQAIESLGCTQLSSMGNLNGGVAGDSPYIFFTEKGTNNVQEIVGNSNETISLFGLLMESDLGYGDIVSTVIGPAYEWDELSWKHKDDEPTGKDSLILYVIGIDLQGNETVVDTFYTQQDRISNYNNFVDAAQYPYLKLKANVSDSSLSTSGQLERWHVLYDGIPEAALDPHTTFTFESDTLQEGNELKVSVAIENVSLYDMDSLRVAYWIVQPNGNSQTIDYPKQAPLLAGDFLTDEVTMPTIGLKQGFNTLWIDVNPEDSEWQLEQYHFNNFARKSFYLQKDNTNPILDITFDGIHILDGDIVSPEPSIVIELDDENPYLAISDTSSFDLYITDPEGVQRLITFQENSANGILTFTPAELPENKARVEYNPTFSEDGIYKLTVQGRDASENDAGDYSYTISFEVIQQSSITQILNYPNPFSTSTRFVFVLTGSHIPDLFKIQILTSTGKVVREITQDEIGPINIGRNISQYAWDGTDEFGDPLANGVYLYRVVSKIGGQDIEHRSSEADNFFHKGFGKMYLMR